MKSLKDFYKIAAIKKDPTYLDFLSKEEYSKEINKNYTYQKIPTCYILNVENSLIWYRIYVLMHRGIYYIQIKDMAFKVASSWEILDVNSQNF